MANVISDNKKGANDGGAYNVAEGCSGAKSGATSLRDVCNLLKAAPVTSACPYDQLVEQIRGLDIQDDGILLNQKINSILTDFCNIVRDENMLCESMEYINDKALDDGDTSIKFALLFASRTFDALAMKDIKIRHTMLTLLERNYRNAETYRINDRERLYNSITLLGEYYHRVRNSGNLPITILGKSLLDLLLREVRESTPIDAKFAKIILSQITLNGDNLRSKHNEELTQVLFHIRRNLIEQPALKSSVKALLLMTLDLYYSNFANIGAELEEMYTIYLVQQQEDEGNNNNNMGQHLQEPSQLYQLQEELDHTQSSQNATLNNAHSNCKDNGEIDNFANDSYESKTMVSTKKWSEQVCEDSMFENDFIFDYNGGNEINISGDGSCNTSMQERLSSHQDGELQHAITSHRSRRRYEPRSPPRPLKSSTGSHIPPHHKSIPSQPTDLEDRDQSKPLPRWRRPRFNRDPEHDEKSHHAQRRHSVTYDDDRQSVRSEGGSIRLYSVNDRLRHSQDKIERSGPANNYNYIVNSNWDRQSQRDDRSERSYASNYERGNRKHGNRHYNNRQSYDKPPRFQKNQQQQPEQQHHEHGSIGSNDKKVHSESWRRSKTSTSNNYQDENSSYGSNSYESSNRSRTLPRPGKSKMESGNTIDAHRRSQSPSRGNRQRRGSNSNSRKYATHYGSQSSLTSETSGTVDRRFNQRNRNNSRHGSYDELSVLEKQDENLCKTKENTRETSELVRNARQTTNYMNYLSSK